MSRYSFNNELRAMIKESCKDYDYRGDKVKLVIDEFRKKKNKEYNRRYRAGQMDINNFFKVVKQ